MADERLKMEKTLAVGDVCYLNSGSPPLTVTAIDGDAATVCWVSDKSPALTATFPLVCLRSKGPLRMDGNIPPSPPPDTDNVKGGAGWPWFSRKVE